MMESSCRNPEFAGDAAVIPWMVTDAMSIQSVNCLADSVFLPCNMVGFRIEVMMTMFERAHESLL